MEMRTEEKVLLRGYVIFFVLFCSVLFSVYRYDGKKGTLEIGMVDKKSVVVARAHSIQ